MSFWQEFQKSLQGGISELGSNAEKWRTYCSDSLWTKVAVEAAKLAVEGMDLESQREYYKVDLIGFEKGEKWKDLKFGGYDWWLKVAFEHENSNQWRDELCKLTHLAADLCVLVTYHGGIDDDIRSELSGALEVMGDRMTRVPGRGWLFVFGPNVTRCKADRNACFKAFTLNDDGELVSLADASEVSPGTWMCRDAT